MIPILINLGISFLLLFIMMSLIWFIQYKNGNAGIVDIFWGISFPFSTSLYFLLTETFSVLHYIILTMVIAWGFRLAIYLFGRNWDKPEDARYTNLRKEWGRLAQVKMFFFFQFQALLSSLLSIPFLLVLLDSQPEIRWVHYLAIGLWLVGLIGESIADEQLRRFKMESENHGHVCATGLWYYSRHPNYFFEWIIWVAYFLFAISSPFGWWAILSPILMLHFLLNVTGIKYSEEHMLQSKGDAYRKYKETTSSFIPLPKKIK